MVVEGANEEEMGFVIDKNKQKGKLHMDLIIATLWPHKEYSASMGEDIWLTGKFISMLETTSGGGCIPRSNEVRSPSAIFGQKAAKIPGPD